MQEEHEMETDDFQGKIDQVTVLSLLTAKESEK